MIFALDPGPELTAYCCLAETGVPFDWGHVPNAAIRPLVMALQPSDRFAVEMIASYGMGVGKEVFDTCLWIGRILEMAPVPAKLIYRMEVKQAICRCTRANDSTIRYALMDRFGGKLAAIGKKAYPGPLFGLTGDCWAALAVAMTYYDHLNSKTS